MTHKLTVGLLMVEENLSGLVESVCYGVECSCYSDVLVEKLPLLLGV